MDKAQLFIMLDQELETANIPLREVEKAQQEIENYLSVLEGQLRFSLSVLLEDFVTARR
ncbi:MAG: hypothetical protein HXS46_13240 [Theionarchaea archaeon]|nr:hypothetical protein [Theionarchaea archaeon]